MHEYEDLRRVEKRIEQQDKWIVDLYQCISHLAHRYHKLKREIRKLKKERGNEIGIL